MQAMVRALRRSIYRESTTAFGQRVCASRRAVEEWEAGRRQPRGLTAKTLQAMYAKAMKPRLAKGA